MKREKRTRKKKKNVNEKGRKKNRMRKNEE